MLHKFSFFPVIHNAFKYPSHEQDYKVMVKLTLEQFTKGQSGRRCVDVLFL